MSVKCPHTDLMARLRSQGKFGEQRGYCSQQCKGWITVYVQKPAVKHQGQSEGKE